MTVTTIPTSRSILNGNFSAPVDDGWQRDDNGRIRPNEANFLTAMRKLGIALSRNEFSGDGYIHGLDGHGPRFDDAARREIYLLLPRAFGFRIGREDLSDMIYAEMHRHRFHPVQDYLSSLEWDGVPRLDGWLLTYAGADDTDYVSTVGRIMLVAAVRRIFQPGCKFDEMPIFESPEGRDKSTAIAVLAGEEHFTDEAPFGLEARQVIESLRGKWIIEAAELDAMSRTEVTGLKAFLSRREDRATLKYERETTGRPRSCVFWGTTNDDSYLVSKTGNRRFWPIPIERFDIEALRRDRDQLWAEAVVAHEHGESIRLPERLWGAAAVEQEKREVGDEWDGTIADYLEVQQREHFKQGVLRVRVRDIATGALGMGTEKLDQRTEKRIASALQKLNWKMTIRSNGNRWWTKVQ